MSGATQHVPVLLHEAMEMLRPQPGGQFIDCTLGAGGHTSALLDRTAPDGKVLALDADPVPVERARARLADYGDRAHLAHSNFVNLKSVAASHGFHDVDGILLDLGLSSDQLASDRGFSFQRPGVLDMRFDTTQGTTAAELVNTLAVDELADLIYDYGEERASRRIARAIVAARPIRNAEQLAQVIVKAKGQRRGKIHPATLTFQALRIAVNDELDSLKTVLPIASGLLQHGGRMAVIAFHSLEDRIVKRFMRRESRAVVLQPDSPPNMVGRRATVRLVTKRPVVAHQKEVEANPRARSARLRVAEKI